MKVKRYEASSMEEAIAKVKADLGPEAIILHTRRLHKAWPFNMINKSAVEITAALDINVSQPRSNGEVDLENVDDGRTILGERFDQLEVEIDEIKSIVKTIANQLTDPLFQEVPACFLDIYERLLLNKVDDEIAKKLMKSAQEKLTTSQMADPDMLQESVAREMAQLLPVCPPLTLAEGERKVVALIGPTGAGKTTTIAKLAARYSLYEGRKVLFITADTYRVAAVEQLRTYADIIGAPIEIVFSNQDVREALERHEDKELVFIDTAGRSPHNDAQINELAGLMNICTPDEIHLVLSVTTKLSDQMHAINRFSSVPVNKLIFTKLDETNTPGTILNIVNKVKVPISYLTIGQNVPEDISVAESKDLANIILGVPQDE